MHELERSWYELLRGPASKHCVQPARAAAGKSPCALPFQLAAGRALDLSGLALFATSAVSAN